MFTTRQGFRGVQELKVSTIQSALAKINVATSKGVGRVEVRETLSLLLPLSLNIPFIRIGDSNRADGSYLVPDDIDGLTGLYSPGVADNVGFELFFAQRGVPCFMVDGSIDALPVQHKEFTFMKKWLGPADGDDQISLNSWVREGEELALQMDIEGAEYEAILATDDEVFQRFRLLVIEFHDFRSCITRQGSRLIRSTLEKLGRSHNVVHCHVNNAYPPMLYKGVKVPEVVEITFLRKDRAIFGKKHADLPHELDRPNTDNPDWTLDFKSLLKGL